MARSFNGSSDKLSYAGALVTAAPLTMAAWIKRGTTLVNGTVMFIGNSGSFGNVNLWRMNRVFVDDGDAQVLATACTTTTGAASATCVRSVTDWPEGTWGHAAAVFESDSSRYAYAQGVASSQNTTTKTPSGVNITTLGKSDNVSGTSWFSGEMAEVGLWNVALSSSDVAVLAAGVCPLLVHPESLVAYWPILGQYSPEIDVRGGANLTLTGSPSATAHPLIYYAAGPMTLGVPDATPSGVPNKIYFLPQAVRTASYF